jgi:hypothetical protein
MKKKVLLTSILLIVMVALGVTNYSKAEKKLTLANQHSLSLVRDGDIIFQTSQSAQCEAVRIATNSKFSHCGIIFKIDDEPYVYEAVQPVKLTHLKEWITHGAKSDYLVKRLKNASEVLNPNTIEQMKSYGYQFKNKDYDLYFDWSDDKIYCSELVWKIYKNGANISLCSLERLENFNLKNDKVKAILQERYGNNIPLKEQVVAPSQLVNSNQLITVIDTY